MKFNSVLIKGKLIRRYKRFFTNAKTISSRGLQFYTINTFLINKNQIFF